MATKFGYKFKFGKLIQHPLYWWLETVCKKIREIQIPIYLLCLSSNDIPVDMRINVDKNAKLFVSRFRIVTSTTCSFDLKGFGAIADVLRPQIPRDYSRYVYWPLTHIYVKQHYAIS